MRLSALRARWYLPLTAIVTAVAIAATGLAPSAQAASRPRFSADSLANALLFGHGPAARYLVSPKVAHRRLNAATVRLEARIDRELAANPGAAATFAQDVQSGNPVQVSSGLAILGQLTRDTLEGLYGRAVTAHIARQANTELRKAVSQAKAGSLIGIYLYNVNYEININDALNYSVIDFVLAGAVALVVVLFVVLPPAPASASGHLDGSQLVVDQFVSYVTTHLRAASAPNSARA